VNVIAINEYDAVVGALDVIPITLKLAERVFRNSDAHQGSELVAGSRVLAKSFV
jgi:hypothetical protein